MSFHINAKGEAGKCHAEKGGCPFGNTEEHYATAAEVQKAFENTQDTFVALEKAPDFADLGDGWKDDPKATYENALKEAKKLKAEGKFVVISTSYSAADMNYTDEPVYEDFDDEEDFDEAHDDWENSLPVVGSTDELSYFFPEGERTHTAMAFDSREAFEAELKAEGVPGVGGAGEAEGVLDEKASSSTVYKSVPETGVTNSHMAWYFEARVV